MVGISACYTATGHFGVDSCDEWGRAEKGDIVEAVRRNQSQIQALGVKRLGLFGSFVRGEQRSDSDVDMLVEFERGQKTFDHFIQLSFLLEDLLGRGVELVTPEALSPYIGPHILKEVEYVSVAA